MRRLTSGIPCRHLCLFIDYASTINKASVFLDALRTLNYWFETTMECCFVPFPGCNAL